LLRPHFGKDGQKWPLLQLDCQPLLERPVKACVAGLVIEIGCCDNFSLNSLDLGQKTIAAPRDSLDIRTFARAFAQDLPQDRNVAREIALLDYGFRPNRAHQLFLFHNVAAALDQRREQVIGSTPFNG